MSMRSILRIASTIKHFTYFKNDYPFSIPYCRYYVFNLCSGYDKFTLIVKSSMPAFFVYSQQCSSAMISSYVPIYVIMYGLTGVLVPVLQLIIIARYHDYSALIDDQRNTLEYMKLKLYVYNNLTQGIVSRMTLPILMRDGSTLGEVIAIHNTNMLDDADSSSVKIIRKFYNVHRLSIN